MKVSVIALKLEPNANEDKPNRTLSRAADKKWTALREDGQVDAMHPWEAALIVEIQNAILRWSAQGDAK